MTQCYRIDTYCGLSVGDTVTYDGNRMRLEALERIPGGVAAELRGIDGVTYPHPVYLAGFTTAADHIAPATVTEEAA